MAMTTNTKTILLVENDPRDVELTLAVIGTEKLSAKVVVLENGAEALDYLYYRGRFEHRQAGYPAAVLLDHRMPKVTGLEVLQVMRSDACLRAIPVVVFTSSREPTDLFQFYAQGVNAYVVKPLDFSEFTKAVGCLGVFWASVNEPPLIAAEAPPFLSREKTERLGNPMFTK